MKIARTPLRIMKITVWTVLINVIDRNIPDYFPRNVAAPKSGVAGAARGEAERRRLQPLVRRHCRRFSLMLKDSTFLSRW